MANQDKTVSSSAVPNQAMPMEDVRFLRPSAVPGAEILMVRRSLHRWRVFHELYNVCTPTAGTTEWHYRGKKHVANAGDIGFLEPGETHVIKKVHARADFNVLLFNPGVFEQAAQELGISGTPHFSLIQENNPMIFRAFQRFYASVEQGESPLEQQSRFAHCLRLLMAYSVEGGRPPECGDAKKHVAISRAEAFLREHFNRAVTLDELCTVAGVSRFYFIRSFNKHFGLPPHAYQTQLRMTRARLMLQSGVLPSVIGGLIGFADQSHFTRHFRKTFGVTPGRYATMIGAA